MTTLTASNETAIVDNSWKGHFLATLALSIPLIGAQLAQLGIHVTDVFIVGRLGTAELAAMVLAGQYFFTLFIFGSGFATAVVPLAAYAYAQGDTMMVRRSVRMGLWVIIGFGFVTAPPIWFAENVLLFAGQDPHVAKLAGDYLQIAGWGMIPALAFMVLRSFLSAVGHARIILYVTLVVLVFNAFCAYVLVLGHFGMPALGMKGAAIVALCANVLSVLLTLVYIQKHRELRSYEVFVRFWRSDMHVLWEVFRLGLPICLTILAEVSLFTVASLLMGWIGTVELAAHGIALQWASVAFMIPLGLAQAVTVRVGLAAGAADHKALVRASWVAVLIAAGCSMIGSVLFALYPVQLASVYLDTAKPDSAAVLAYASGLVVIAGIFQLVDGLQAVAAGLLRGVKDTTVPMILALISYWPVGFLLAYVLAFPFGMGGIGIWIGFVFGLIAASVLLLGRYVILVRRQGRAT
ncbi:MATE family efflux transporter [Rhizobium sp. KVB221]|uniref:Multidrug-efflux transporter n=1 Tax=Rhizobium setariae TaxID=2801340 RepID=A0A936YSL9_9HYPH|nr:MATE family efflux transporter [Rhizobium setariae]MBL0371922.1 MATE family efflux transporter [Rhizobium setariae]